MGNLKTFACGDDENEYAYGRGVEWNWAPSIVCECLPNVLVHLWEFWEVDVWAQTIDLDSVSTIFVADDSDVVVLHLQ